MDDRRPGLRWAVVGLSVAVVTVTIALVAQSSLPERAAVGWILRSVVRDRDVDAALAADEDGLDVWLVAGSDDRSRVPDPSAVDYGWVDGQRADLVMLVALDPAGGPLRVLSVPRDLAVDTPRFGQLLVGETFGYGGSALLVESVSAITGVAIDHYVEWSFDGFVHLVDSVGGIDVELCSRMRDEAAFLDLPAGPLRLDGNDTLAMARTRAGERFVDGAWVPGRQGDRERTARQLALVDLLTARVTTAEGIGERHDIARAVAASVVADRGLDARSILDLQRIIRNDGIDARRLGAIPIRSQDDRRSPFGEHLGGRLYLQPSIDSLTTMRWFEGVDVPVETGASTRPASAPPISPDAPSRSLPPSDDCW